VAAPTPVGAVSGVRPAHIRELPATSGGGLLFRCRCCGGGRRLRGCGYLPRPTWLPAHQRLCRTDPRIMFGVALFVIVGILSTRAAISSSASSQAGPARHITLHMGVVSTTLVFGYQPPYGLSLAGGIQVRGGGSAPVLRSLPSRGFFAHRFPPWSPDIVLRAKGCPQSVGCFKAHRVLICPK